jgi:hypothetical protein
MKAPELSTGKDKDVGIPFDGKGVFFILTAKTTFCGRGQS